MKIKYQLLIAIICALFINSALARECVNGEKSIHFEDDRSAKISFTYTNSKGTHYVHDFNNGVTKRCVYTDAPIVLRRMYKTSYSRFIIKTIYKNIPPNIGHCQFQWNSHCRQMAISCNHWAEKGATPHFRMNGSPCKNH